MIKFYDSGGTVHFGQATITRTTSVNGGLSLTGEVFAGDDVLNGLDYGWWLNFDNEKYVITYKKLSDDTNTVVFDAVQQFFWDFAKVALHAQYTGSHEYTFYLGQLFDKSGYTYKNDVTVPAFEKENWGYKNKLDLFNDIMDQAGVEFEVHNEIVHIAKQIGSDLTSFVRKGINLSNLTEEMKISDFATYAKGYGAFKDAEDQSKGRLEVEYRSELAKQFGDLEMDPIVDERYTVADNLIAALKKQVDATYTVSMTMNIYDLENAGYPNYEAPKVGDWILAIDEALNFKRKIRIIQLEEQFDVTGKRIGYTATCGDLSIVDQYTHLQSSLDSKVQRIQESVDTAMTSANGKNTNYYGAKEPMSANEGDLWFDQSDSDPDKWSIKQWVNGRWQQITLNPGEVDAKVDVAKKEAETAVENANTAVDKANQVAAKYDDTQQLASQALNNSLLAQTDAADSLKQIAGAVADAASASTIANAVQQRVITLTDGSTMTIAELENGLATKLVKSDLDNYATKTWASNQISVTADGINTEIGKVQTSLDNTTTTVNSLAATSLGIKLQLSSLNTQATQNKTDIATLQGTTSSLTSNIQTLQSSNLLTKMNVSQLQQTSTTMNSTLMDVQTVVQNSAVGVNLLRNTNPSDNSLMNKPFNPDKKNWTITSGGDGVGTFIPVTEVPAEYGFQILNNTAGNRDFKQYFDYTNRTYVFSVYAKSLRLNDVTALLRVWDDDKGTELGHYFQALKSADGWQRLTLKVNANSYTLNHRVGIQFGISDVGSIIYACPKLEAGDTPTDYSINPMDSATVNAVSSLSQTVDSLSATVRSKVDDTTYQSKVTQLSNQITSVVGQVNNSGQRNLVANSQFQYNRFDGTTWTSNNSANWYMSNFAWSWWNGYQGICTNITTTTDTTRWDSIVSKKVYVPDTATHYSASAIVNVDTVGIRCQLVLDFYDQSMKRIGYQTKGVTILHVQNLVKIEGAVPPTGTAYVAWHFDVQGGGHLAVIAPMLVAGDTVGPFVPDNATWTEFQQTASDINLKVSKNGVVNAVNISPEGIQIYGNKLHITASTYIDNAVIKSAMIAGLDAGKINTGVLNANLVNVININGANITANTITANQLAVGSVLVNLNNTLQTLRITTDGIFTTDSKGANVGHIHSNYLVGHPDLYGLAFDLDAEGDYMTWGAQNRGQPTSNYSIKLGWYRNDIASTIGSPAGFVFGDPATFNKPVTFTGGIKVPNAGSNLTTGTSSFNSYAYPYFGDDGMKAGWAYGTSETYLISGGSFYNASKIIKALNNLGALQLPQSIRSDGTVAKYYNVTL